MFVQLCGYRHMCATVHVWRFKDNFWGQSLSFTLFETGSHLFLLHTPALMACQLLGILLCPLRSTQIADIHTTIPGFARVLGMELKSSLLHKCSAH